MFIRALSEHHANALLLTFCSHRYLYAAGLQRLRFKERKSAKQDRRQAARAGYRACTDGTGYLQPVLEELRTTLALWTLFGLTFISAPLEFKIIGRPHNGRSL